MTQAELFTHFLTELDRSLIVDDKTREYWLNNYKTLPFAAVTFFYEELRKANQDIDRMIDAGMEANPETVREINQKMKDAKRKLNQFKEKESQEEENPEQFLTSNL